MGVYGLKVNGCRIDMSTSGIWVMERNVSIEVRGVDASVRAGPREKSPELLNYMMYVSNKSKTSLIFLLSSSLPRLG